MDAPTATSHSAEKRANRTPPLPYPQRVQLKQDAANMIANMMAASLAAGGVGAGIQGIAGMFKRRKLPGFKRDQPGETLAVPRPEEEEEKYAALQKAARTPTDADWATGEWQTGGPKPPPAPKPKAPAKPAGPPAPKPEFKRNILGNTVGRTIYENLMRTPPDKPTIASGDFATKETGIPLTLGLGLPLSLLAFYGGYKGIGSLINKRRKTEKEDELQDAKRRYAELSNSRAKHASDDLDTLSATCVRELEKQSENEPGGPVKAVHRVVGGVPGAGDMLGWGGGLGLAYALLSGAGAGKLSYDFFRKRSRPKVLEEALKERNKRRARETGGVAPAYFYIPEDEREERAVA